MSVPTVPTCNYSRKVLVWQCISDTLSTRLWSNPLKRLLFLLPILITLIKAEEECACWCLQPVLTQSGFNGEVQQCSGATYYLIIIISKATASVISATSNDMLPLQPESMLRSNALPKTVQMLEWLQGYFWINAAIYERERCEPLWLLMSLKGMIPCLLPVSDTSPSWVLPAAFIAVGNMGITTKIFSKQHINWGRSITNE